MQQQHQDTPSQISSQKGQGFSNFFDDEFLSDCILEKGDSSAIFKAHRVVLAAASKFFYTFFKEHPIQGSQPVHVPLPRPIVSENPSNQLDIVPNALKFIYSSQEMKDLLELGLTQENSFSYLSYFHAIQCEKGKRLTLEYMLDQVLAPENCTSYLIDAIKLDDPELMKRSLDLVVHSFTKIISDENQHSHLLKLPFEVIKDILGNDDLQIEDENKLVTLVADYIKTREGLPTKEEIEAEQRKVEAPSKEEIKPKTFKSEEKPKEEAPTVNSPKQEKKDEVDLIPEKEKPQTKEPEEPKKEEDEVPTQEEPKTEEPQAEEKPKEEVEPEPSKPEDKDKEKAPEEGEVKNEEAPKTEEPNTAEAKPEENQEVKAESPKEGEAVKEGTLETGESKTEPKVEEPKPEEPKAEKKQEEPKPEPKVDEPVKKEAPQEKAIPAREVVVHEDFESQGQLRIKPYKLSFDEKKELIKLIRLPYLTHETLMRASQNPIFADFKDIFLESLSAKLNNYEASHIDKYSINVNPRASFINLTKSQANIQGSPVVEMTKGKSVDNLQRPQPNLQKTPTSHSPLEKTPVHGSILQSMQQRNHQVFTAYAQQLANSFPQPNVQANQYVPIYNKQQLGQSQSIGLPQIQNPYNPRAKTSYGQNIQKGGLPFFSPQKFYRPIEFQGNPYDYDIDDEIRETQKLPPHRGLLESSKVKEPHSPDNIFGSTVKSTVYGEDNLVKSKIRPADKLSSPQKTDSLLFSYKYDFDDNGALYYLGTAGKKFPWQNPHKIGQVKVFFSSLGKGSVEDFVGRDCVNCRTLNEPNSFMGVDLGVNRYLIPSCYTIRNRNSSHHVLMNWVLEVSINGKEWFWLDKRVHLTDDEQTNKELAQEREELKQKGYTSTWGIDEAQISKIQKHIEESQRVKFKGFRYFKIVQISKNSSGSFNLGLSGFELYGQAFGENWLF